MFLAAFDNQEQLTLTDLTADLNRLLSSNQKWSFRNFLSFYGIVLTTEISNFYHLIETVMQWLDADSLFPFGGVIMRTENAFTLTFVGFLKPV